jgi:hypothetical protein
MKVICENNDYYPAALKTGNVYDVYIAKDSTFIIIDEFLENQEYPRNIFKIMEHS